MKVEAKFVVPNELVELRCGDFFAKIAVSAGNNLIGFGSGEDNVMYFPYTIEEYRKINKLAGNPFMYPWSNRLEKDAFYWNDKRYLIPSELLENRDSNGLAMHGLILKSNLWESVELSSDGESAWHRARMNWDSKHPLFQAFPFQHALELTHRLKGNELQLDVAIINLDDNEMPLAFGFHPYYSLQSVNRNKVHINIPARTMLDLDERLLPNGRSRGNPFYIEGHFNLNGYHFDHLYHRLSFSDTGSLDMILHFPDFRLEISHAADFEYLIVYAPNNISKPYICFEPMMTATNALSREESDESNKIKSIGAGQTFKTFIKWRMV